MVSSTIILQRLTDAYQQQALNESITLEMLPFFAEALEPYLSRYEAKEGSFPDQKTFLVIVDNFHKDGPLVQALLDANAPDSAKLWAQIRENLRRKTGLRWPDLEIYVQQEIVSQTLERLQQYLPKFLFKSEFATWLHTIWQNEYRRVMKKMVTRRAREVSLDKKDDQGRSLQDTLASSETDPQHIVSDNPAWARLAQLETNLHVRMLRFHIEGYTLKEIKEKLGDEGPSIATIKRHLDKIKEQLKTDEAMRKIAQDLGFLKDER